MSFVTTLFFAASSFSYHDPISLSQLKLLPIVTPKNLYRYKLGKIIMTGICIGIS